MSANLNTPVLLLGFNRPHLIVHPFEAIRAARPRQLFFAVDGPREGVPGERERVDAVRAFAARVDWDCELQTRFRDRNMGCGRGVADALAWFFGNVEEGIVLEDDLIPDPSFFPFCRELLARYRADERVTTISGYNFLGGGGGGAVPWSYLFTRYISLWGWASWRRVWRHYDFDARAWPKAKAEGMLDRLFAGREERRHWGGQFDMASAGAVDTWDIQWGLACWLLGGLTAMPAGNLVRNVGFGADATHTPRRFHCGKTSVTPMQFPMRHPPDVTIDPRCERRLFRVQKKPLPVVLLQGLREMGPAWVLRRAAQRVINGHW